MSAASNHNWFDTESGILDRRIFADEEIYQEELKKIFGRAWNFMCHESQIPETGDFFMNWIGEDEVIIVRDGDGAINVLLNSCPHRGNT
ncbi:MAG: Rieske 2Fe-2S domain-containing protein, partial [Pseudomonadota bacterium]|nr:Rieske 2Fe-2S domain-containing protein [Pseudomonadota bacterium]